MGIKELKDINWLPTEERFEQNTAINIFKFVRDVPRCSHQLARAGSLEDLKAD